MRGRMKSRHFINSIDRVFQILETCSKGAGEKHIGDIAKATGMATGTTHRYLYTLKELGYIQQDPESRKYQISMKVLELGFHFLKSLDLRKRVLPHMMKATQALGVNSHCAILDGFEVVYIERVRGKSVVDLDIAAGYRLPAHCNSMGKMLLSLQDQDVLREKLKRVELASLTPYTITEPKRLLAELAEIKRRGYAESDRELNEGVYAVAAAVYRNGKPEGAVGLSLSSHLARKRELRRRLIDEVKRIAEKASF